jgi:hypothetical protein
MHSEIIRSIKRLRINDLYRQMQGEFDVKPWFENFVIKLIYLQTNELKILTMV